MVDIFNKFNVNLDSFQNQINRKNNNLTNKNFIELIHQFPFMLYKNPSMSEIYSKMQKMRIIKKNLVYLIGLPKELAFNENILNTFEYLGQYGKIVKLKSNKNKKYNITNPNGPSYSCHITYSSPIESSLAILSLENIQFENHIFKASFGTTKYCSNFLHGVPCTNKDCLFLHYLANDDDILNRDEMNSNNQVFKNQLIMAIELSEIYFNDNVKKKLDNIKNQKTIFPNASLVYEKEFIKNYYNENKDKIELNNENKINKKGKKIFNIFGYNNYLKRTNKSRFDFATNSNENNDEIKIKISNFISEKIKRSILFEKESSDISDYYFSMKKSYDAEDRWKSLINTLEMYDSFNCNNDRNKLINDKNNDILIINKFDTF